MHVVMKAGHRATLRFAGRYRESEIVHLITLAEMSSWVNQQTDVTAICGVRFRPEHGGLMKLDTDVLCGVCEERRVKYARSEFQPIKEIA